MPHPLIWAEIDQAAIAHNVREIRRITDPKAQLMIAVKANGYGHGAMEVARIALENGADQLGVARLQEGMKLRKAGIEAPILVMGHTPVENTQQLLDNHLTPTIYAVKIAQQMSAAAKAQSRTLTFHIKVDSGMGRLGLPCSALTVAPETGPAEQIITMAKLPGLKLGGLFTHFATADHSNKEFARLQFSRFLELLSELDTAGLQIPLRHAANSGAIIDMPETHLDMVRAGVSVYGLYPSAEVNQRFIDLRPALQLKAKIIHLKKIPIGAKTSYGGTWEAVSPTTIATVPAGYGDGYSRQLSNRGHMLVNGERAPIVGRVCMDLTMLDVGHIEGINLEDEVVLLGRQGRQTITAEEIAAQMNTINYEVVTSLMARVKRIYK